MVIKGFSISEVIKFGWMKMKNQLGFFILLLLLCLFLSFLIPFIFEAIFAYNNPSSELSTDQLIEAWKNQHPFLMFLMGIGQYIINLMVQVGLVHISLKVSGDEKGRFRDLFNTFPLIWNYFLSHILYYLIVLVGLVLFIIPGIIFAVRYSLYPFFIVDKKVGPIEALKLSAKTTYGAKWDLFSLIIVSWIILLVGALCLLVGLFAAIPTVLIACALAYRKLLSQTEI